MRRIFGVKITAHPQKQNWYIARYESEFLGAHYLVEFPDSITGAVALCHFVEMLKTRYPDGEVTFQLPVQADKHAVVAVADAWSMQTT